MKIRCIEANDSFNYYPEWKEVMERRGNVFEVIGEDDTWYYIKIEPEDIKSLAYYYVPDGKCLGYRHNKTLSEIIEEYELPKELFEI